MAIINYSKAIELLTLELENIVIDSHLNVELISHKKNIKNAINWLNKGMEYQIEPNCDIIAFPEQLTPTPSSEFRIVEDHETDDSTYWTEIEFENKKIIRPMIGDFMIISK